MFHIKEKLYAVRDLENAPYMDGRIADSVEYKLAKEQARAYVNDVINKFGLQNGMERLSQMFNDPHYKEALLDFTRRIDAFMEIQNVDEVTKDGLIIRFYADVFELVCTQLKLIVSRPAANIRLTCGLVREHLKRDHPGRYDHGLYVWLDNFLRNAVDHSLYNIDHKTKKMIVWNTNKDDDKIDSKGNKGTENRDAAEYFEYSLSLYFFFIATMAVFWEKAFEEAVKRGHTFDSLSSL